MNSEQRPGLMRKSAKLLGNTFLQVLGYGHIKAGGRYVTHYWDRLRRIDCPQCLHGRLYPFSTDDGDMLGCNQCSHFQLRDAKTSTESIAYFNGRAMEQLSQLSQSELVAQLDSHKRRSRINYMVSLGLVLFDMYFLVSDMIRQPGTGLSYFTVLIISLVFFSKGLAYAYRYWQVESKTLFVEGAFYRWLRSGNWFV